MLDHLINLDLTIHLDLKLFSDYSIISNTSGVNFLIHWASRLSQTEQNFITCLVILGCEYIFHTSGTQGIIWGSPESPRPFKETLKIIFIKTERCYLTFSLSFLTWVYSGHFPEAIWYVVTILWWLMEYLFVFSWVLKVYRFYFLIW